MTPATPKPCAGEHTKGPWRYVQEDNAIVGADGFLISDCTPRSADFGMKERNANARRIVACVNACEGYPTEGLEMAIPGSFFTATNTIAERDSLREREREMVRLLEKALGRSAVVHPGFADEIRAVLAQCK